MNRRSFIGSILAAAAAPSLLLSRSPDAYLWKPVRSIRPVRVVINPDYANAQWEIEWLVTPLTLDGAVHIKDRNGSDELLPPGAIKQHLTLPVRFKVDPNNYPMEKWPQLVVQPYMKIEA